MQHSRTAVIASRILYTEAISSSWVLFNKSLIQILHFVSFQDMNFLLHKKCTCTDETITSKTKNRDAIVSCNHPYITIENSRLESVTTATSKAGKDCTERPYGFAVHSSLVSRLITIIALKVIRCGLHHLFYLRVRIWPSF